MYKYILFIYIYVNISVYVYMYVLRERERAGRDVVSTTLQILTSPPRPRCRLSHTLSLFPHTLTHPFTLSLLHSLSFSPHYLTHKLSYTHKHSRSFDDAADLQFPAPPKVPPLFPSHNLSRSLALSLSISPSLLLSLSLGLTRPGLNPNPKAGTIKSISSSPNQHLKPKTLNLHSKRNHEA